MATIAVRFAMMPGGCETCESAGQQRKSAIQQEHQLPEIITQAKIFVGNAERPPHFRSGIDHLPGRNAGRHERSRKAESSQSTL
jgi:hypothetical protein